MQISLAFGCYLIYTRNLDSTAKEGKITSLNSQLKPELFQLSVSQKFSFQGIKKVKSFFLRPLKDIFDS